MSTFFTGLPKMLTTGQELVDSAIQNGNFNDFKKGIETIRDAAISGYKPAHKSLLKIMRNMHLGNFINEEMETNPKTLEELSIPQRSFDNHRSQLSNNHFKMKPNN
jgi:hypothetical protein